ncbi:MAG TPA: hypothetical protein VK994_07080, partial [Bacteroidales bacterium]|nr:hypothetical protein [Bacteroidales bacterium]
MKGIHVNLDQLEGFVSREEVYGFSDEIRAHFRSIAEMTGKGNDFLGWVDLPVQVDESLFSEIEESAKLLIRKSEILVVTGIGGSYLGARAVIDALNH